MYRYLATALAVLIVVASPLSSSAHPWGGLVVDSSGSIYFTFVCPMVGDSHHACVWKMDIGSEPSPVLKSSSDPSDMILARSADRTVFAAERIGTGPYRTRLWKLSGTTEPVLMVPFSEDSNFNASPYAVNNKGDIYFFDDGKLRKVSTSSESSSADRESAVTSRDYPIDPSIAGVVGNMFIKADHDMMIVYDSRLALVRPDGTVRVIAPAVKKSDPPEVPFNGANILFDMTTAADGNTYFAYYGNREVLKVDTLGNVSSILSSGSDWSPHGVDEHNDSIYVLESTTPPKAWEIWKDGTLRPRIRVLRPSGTIETLFEKTVD